MTEAIPIIRDECCKKKEWTSKKQKMAFLKALRFLISLKEKIGCKNIDEKNISIRLLIFLIPFNTWDFYHYTVMDVIGKLRKQRISLSFYISLP